METDGAPLGDERGRDGAGIGQSSRVAVKGAGTATRGGTRDAGRRTRGAGLPTRHPGPQTFRYRAANGCPGHPRGPAKGQRPSSDRGPAGNGPQRLVPAATPRRAEQAETLDGLEVGGGGLRACGSP